METTDIQYPLTKVGAAVATATTVNVVAFTEWFQLVAAAAAAIYSVIVLVEWGLKKWRKVRG